MAAHNSTFSPPSLPSSSPSASSSSSRPPIVVATEQTQSGADRESTRRTSRAENRTSSVPRDHHHSTRQSRSTLLVESSSSAGSGFAPPRTSSPSLSPSRRCSRDSEDTLVASPQDLFSPSHPSSVNTSSAYPNLPWTSMSESAYPSHADSRQQEFNDSIPAFPSSSTTDRRPLIDLVTNEWQNNNTYRASSFDSTDSYTRYLLDDKDQPPSLHLLIPDCLRTACQRIHVPRRVQRYLGGYVLFLLLLWYWWAYWLSPAWVHEKMLDESAVLAKGSARKGQTFGVNVTPGFRDMLHIGEMDGRFLPGEANPQRRLVFVGDVHGCKDELENLLDKVHFSPTTDHLIFTGDLIAKGPDSSGVIDLAMKLGASCVRGNWEDRTLLAHATLAQKQHTIPGPAENPHKPLSALDDESLSHGINKDRMLAGSLSETQVNWLKACPVILRVGGIKGFNGRAEVVVAHAGLVPGVRLERQDPFQVMNMRSIDLKTRVPSEERTGEPWDKAWNHYQSHFVEAPERATVVYGHDAKRGLNIQKYSKGLDSACLKGGRLTAMILDAAGRQKIVSVACKKYKD